MNGFFKILSALSRLFTMFIQNKDRREGANVVIKTLEDEADEIILKANADRSAVTPTDVLPVDPDCRD